MSHSRSQLNDNRGGNLMMAMKAWVLLAAAATITSFSACGGGARVSSSNGGPAAPKSASGPPSEPAALPSSAFRAGITLVSPPDKLRVGQKETVRIRIKQQRRHLVGAGRADEY